MSDLLLFQLRRVGRNRQYLFFTVLLPALFTVFFTQVFGQQASDAAEYQDYARAYMVSMMAYGAIGAALGATVRLSFDRASGWLRQLRITPVPGSTVLVVDITVGAVLVLPSLVVVALVGRLVNDVQLDVASWALLVAALWLGSVAFVALGLLLGLALDEQAAGGATGICSTVLAALGGLWVPLEVFPEGLAAVGRLLPSYWYAELGRGVVAGGFPGLPAGLAVAAFTAAYAALALVVARRRPLLAPAG